MCVTLSRASLKNTILYAAEARVKDKLVHTLGYQNRAQNLTSGPNAMILPFPASAPMGPDNVLDTSSCTRILKDMSLAIREPSFDRGMTKGLRLGSARGTLQVFEAGAYTVVLAEDATDIPSALNQVPAHKRPALNSEIFDAYAKWYPNWSIALCCFSGKEGLEAEPMLWWYEPKDPHSFFAPALDGHDGRVPDLKSYVEVDHTVIFGSCLEPVGREVDYRDRDISMRVRPFLASKVVGREIKTRMPNGDFVIPVSELKKPSYNRAVPPGA
jgi:hypothetical protein